MKSVALSVPHRTDGGDGLPRGPGATDDGVRLLLHDLQQPVSVLGLLLSAAQRSPSIPQDVRLRLRLASDEVGAIQTLVSDGLDATTAPAAPVLVTADAAGEPAQRAGDATSDLAASVQDVLRPLCAARPGLVHYRFRSRPRVGLDAVAIQRLADNLLQNATRAASSRVEVRVGRRGGQAWLSVEDDGPGFGRTRPGTGLGLTGTTSAVLGAGGSVQFDAGRLGGTRALVSLPLAQRP